VGLQNVNERGKRHAGFDAEAVGEVVPAVDVDVVEEGDVFGLEPLGVVADVGVDAEGFGDVALMPEIVGVDDVDAFAFGDLNDVVSGAGEAADAADLTRDHVGVVVDDEGVWVVAMTGKAISPESERVLDGFAEVGEAVVKRVAAAGTAAVAVDDETGAQEVGVLGVEELAEERGVEVRDDGGQAVEGHDGFAWDGQFAFDVGTAP